MPTMQQTTAEMLASKDCAQIRDMRKECDTRSRERLEGEVDRLRTRERLEATLAGLGELEYLRQRQQLLVKNVLSLPEDTIPKGDAVCVITHEDNYLNSEEKLLEENILLLRKQLNCLRRRDAGLISQLQELDRQISDLRLDTEVAHDHVETDSRPSSGFYELSDGASGSLSNSSNSVFSECLFSCRSSTCLCSPLDTSLCSSDGKLRSADELGSCTECEGLGQGEDQSSGTVRRSLSAPHPPALDTPLDIQSKYHCDLVARNGNDVYRYPSPLHAVAVQSPIFFQTLAGHGKEEGVSMSGEGSNEGQKPEGVPPPAPLVSQSTSWSPASSHHPPTHKRVESYIYSLLQRRAQPMRSNKPRTSINTDPSKSILRQASLCVRQTSLGQGPLQGQAQGPLMASELKTNWQTVSCFQTGSGVGNSEPTSSASPQRQWSVEIKDKLQENGLPHSLTSKPNGYPVSGDKTQNGNPNNNDMAQIKNAYPSDSGAQNGCPFMNSDIQMSFNTNSLLKKKGLLPANKGLPPFPESAVPKDYQGLGSPKANSSPKESKHPCYSSATPADNLSTASPHVVKKQSATPNKKNKPLPSGQTRKEDRPVPESVSLGSSSQSQDEGGGGGGGGGGGHMVSAQYIPAQRQAVKLRKGGGKNVKIVKVRSASAARAGQTSALTEPVSERTTGTRGEKQSQLQTHRSSSRKSRVSEEGSSAIHRVSKRGASGSSSSRLKRIPVSIPEGRVLDKPTTSTMASVSTSRSAASKHHHHHGHAYHGNHHGHHHHGRDPVVVVAKPKYKRNDYRCLRAITEVPYDEAFRRAQRRQRKELLSQATAATTMYLPTNSQFTSPYAYVAGSDSEYSAECASLFHSTIMDTSEDDRSNYTTNRFGDSESSMSEADFVGESTTTSDSEESGGGAGGVGVNWTQFGAAAAGAGGQEMTPAQAKAFVKIKASHNLKKKILRFRSGSLKLMTTV
ncbi:dapper homolog 1 [Aplochiton taeniatus]